MATTKIWAIKDSISRVISYAKNPEKTTFADLKQVLKYFKFRLFEKINLTFCENW